MINIKTPKQIHLFIVLTFFALIAPLIVFSQTSNNNQFYFSNLGIKDGLPQSSVNKILRDYKGYLWIATNQGLSRYNGREVKTVHNGFGPDVFIRFIIEDNQKQLWVGTHLGCYKYNREFDIFEFIDSEYFNLDYTACVSDEKGVYLWSKLFAVYYDYDSHKFRKINYVLSGEIVKTITSVMVLDKNTILLGTDWGGLLKFNKNNCSVEPIKNYPVKNVTAIKMFSDTSILISSYGNGIFKLSKDLKRIERIDFTKYGMEVNAVMDIQPVGKNLIWVATDGGGLGKYNVETKKLEILKHDPNNRFSIPVNSITCIEYDSHGALWFGSVRAGVLKINPVIARSYDSTSEREFLSAVLSFCEDKQIIWIGSDGNGLFKYDRLNQHLIEIPSTREKKIVSITPFSEDQLLLSIYREGLYVFDKVGLKISKLNTSPEIQELIKNTRIETCFKRISEDKILVVGDFCYEYDMNEKIWTKISNNNILPDERFLFSGQANSNEIYLYGNHSVFLYNQKKKEIEQICTLRKEEDKFIRGICVDMKENLWIITFRTLYKFDLKKKQLEKVNLMLPQLPIAMVLDKGDNLWIGMTQSLCRYNHYIQRINFFDASDGIEANEFFSKAILQTSSGDIFMGGANGFVRIYSDRVSDISENKKNIVPVVWNVWIDGVRQNYSFDNEKSVINLKSNQQIIEVEINVNNKDLINKDVFQYRLKGYHNQFITTFGPLISFSRIPPGEYELEIVYTQSDGRLSPVFVPIKLKIDQIWYKTIYFFVLLFILFLVTTLIIIRWNARNNENKARMSIQEHERKSYEQKVKFLININHELRTPLTLIMAPLSRLVSDWDNISTQKLFETIQQVENQSKRMKKIIDMILNIRKMEFENEVFHFSIVSLDDWLDIRIKHFSPEFEAKGVEIEYVRNPDLGCFTIDEAKTEIILSNLISNALKYSDKGKVQILTKKMNNFLRVIVADEGVGLGNYDENKLFTRFYQADNHREGFGIGLSYCKTLLDMMGGRIGAYNNENKCGSTFYFDLPINQESSFSDTEGNLYQHQINKCEKLTNASFSGLALLIVEDEDSLRVFLKQTLVEFFDRVYVASNGIEALKILLEKDIDFIVSDVMMPLMDGIKLCENVKNNIKIAHIPIVLLTARADEVSILTGYKIGADAYLPKPFIVEELLIEIDRILKHRLILREKYKNSGFTIPIEEVTFSKVDEDFLKKLNDVVASNISNVNLNIDLLVDKLAMSRTALYTKANRLLGKGGVKEFINSVRMERAKYYLKNTDLPISEISELIGFNQSKYFSTAFKIATNLTPSEFRTQFKS